MYETEQSSVQRTMMWTLFYGRINFPINKVILGYSYVIFSYGGDIECSSPHSVLYVS